MRLTPNRFTLQRAADTWLASRCKTFKPYLVLCGQRFAPLKARFLTAVVLICQPGAEGGPSEGWTLPWRCDTRGPWTVLSPVTPEGESFRRWMWTLWHLLWTVFTPISYYFIIISGNRNQEGMFGKTRSSTCLENMAQGLYFFSPDLFVILTMWHKLRWN